MKRKLASIQRIKNLEAIRDADMIELATILGWNIVVRKGGFKIGDYVIFIETDSVLPKDKFDKPEYTFLKSKNFRIKTTRIGGVFSQGIAFPITVLCDEDHIIDVEIDPGTKNIIQYGIINGENAIIVMNREDKKDLKEDKLPNNIIVLKEGDDVTDLLGIKRYEYSYGCDGRD